ncbi:tRNA1(Val) A37 N6-methylase TrmN6 [Mesorhizobium soli]|uniref:tRNA1(Val) (adenine(37)-N6)-methyltransferase n=1 Tax=Pseudaminobacter soli (ex Li et al. 2025) TaxID=1295366 RepID=UPI002475063C|nr:methyltransferase [Mesorhizobium soli]MDH6230223.1 tRNA1(Val) A37 N6-methylase TrmN6 [Mesorhizobium soli]
MTIAEREPAAHTTDAFHRGNFWLVQPRDAGHRAGMDALMLAAAVPSDFRGHLADFGAGAGAAGLAVASRCPEASVTLVEQSPEMADFASRTLQHEGNTHLGSRVSLLVADVTLTGKARSEAGLTQNAFDFVIMNPPFNTARDRSTPDELRRQAHVMEDGLFESWLRSAAAVVRPRGGLALIARPQSLPQILAALAGRFGSAEIVPIHPRSDAAAIRIVLRARKGARGALALCPPLILHEHGHKLSPRADDVSNGRGSLFGD